MLGGERCVLEMSGRERRRSSQVQNTEKRVRGQLQRPMGEFLFVQFRGMYCRLSRSIKGYLLVPGTLFLLSLISLDVAFNILQIHENGQKTEKYYVESV